MPDVMIKEEMNVVESVFYEGLVGLVVVWVWLVLVGWVGIYLKNIYVCRYVQIPKENIPKVGR